MDRTSFIRLLNRRCVRRPQPRLPCPHGSLPQARRVRMARAAPGRSRISLASRVGIRGAAAGLLARRSALAANRGLCLDCKCRLARAVRRGPRRDHGIGPRLAHRSGLAPGRDRRRADAYARGPGVVIDSRFGRRGLLRSGVLSLAGATIQSCWHRTATPAASSRRKRRNSGCPPEHRHHLGRLSAVLSIHDTRTRLTHREFVKASGHHSRSRTNRATG